MPPEGGHPACTELFKLLNDGDLELGCLTLSLCDRQSISRELPTCALLALPRDGPGLLAVEMSKANR